ncbi:MAG: hypothetical protein FWE40_09740 [Oscillospiraceae bacterium]|nr:hypothetical protein [Oscillospiraceae bacterium]
MGNLVADLTALLATLDVASFIGAFPKTPPDLYAVLTPMDDSFAVQGDGMPLDEEQQVRISLFSRGNYRVTKAAIERAVLSAGMTILGRRYVGFETEHHHVAIDVANLYFLTKED